MPQLVFGIFAAETILKTIWSVTFLKTAFGTELDKMWYLIIKREFWMLLSLCRRWSIYYIINVLSILYYQCLVISVEARAALHIRDVDLYSGKGSSLLFYLILRVMDPSTLLAIFAAFSVCFASWGLWWWWFLDPSVDLLLATID